MTMRLFLFGMIGGLVLLPLGCGQATTYPVSGTVTYNGEPIPEGYIAFVPEGPGRGGGGAITNGRYSVSVQAGKNRVEITASKAVPLPRGQGGMNGGKEEVRQYLPTRYNFETELRADITQATTLDYQLKSK
jgi:hypothetical protein